MTAPPNALAGLALARQVVPEPVVSETVTTGGYATVVPAVLMSIE